MGWVGASSGSRQSDDLEHIYGGRAGQAPRPPGGAAVVEEIAAVVEEIAEEIAAVVELVVDSAGMSYRGVPAHIAGRCGGGTPG